jgi:transcriptional regulator with XRE-family HTH domain
MSHATFARLVGISKGWPSNMASGRQRPPHDETKLAAWADVLGLTDGERDEFIELALLEHVPERIRERYLSMKSSLRSGGALQ